MKILSIVGARPQFVKAFPVSRALRKRHEEVLVHTGQHYDAEMSDVFFDELDIPEPDEYLGVGSGSHARQTAAMMDGLDDLLDRYDPDVVLVYGDTNSTLAGAMVAAKRDPKLAHVEAGLRSYDRTMPEEVNRVQVDHASDLLFTPMASAVENLEAEGLDDRAVVVGDVMYDAVIAVRERARDHSTILDDVPHDDGEYVLATVHRAVNTDDPDRLAAIVTALGDAPLPVVFPAHPRTIEALQRHGLYEQATTELDLIDPVGYLDFLRLLLGAERVATDSGGVQKEAFYLDTPCVTMREKTEWVETVECGWNVLTGAGEADIGVALRQSFDTETKPELYGDGTASERIAEALTDVV
ncbi:non-hydrolyzing UDP-N-acetylglucosamine 2-epimerase [Haloarchaeobius sp. DFWS5]|uniref:non-hydrolyzing UDP-N-acetylglucosamine 2-epimerase n=1 Tax=Haloarchaeobius sp. DFWS5 TaxID=3446114 RepID=UPI003EBA1C1F